uniref:Uncharacterized protein n=1 Tax=Strigamia maritima TaxID=126957 RepID=T1IP25_STRMM
MSPISFLEIRKIAKNRFFFAIYKNIEVCKAKIEILVTVFVVSVFFALEFRRKAHNLLSCAKSCQISKVNSF